MSRVSGSLNPDLPFSYNPLNKPYKSQLAESRIMRHVGDGRQTPEMNTMNGRLHGAVMSCVVSGQARRIGSIR